MTRNPRKGGGYDELAENSWGVVTLGFPHAIRLWVKMGHHQDMDGRF